MIQDFPWGVAILLGTGLLFTSGYIVYILILAYKETKK